jgi:hypothetical protein
VLWVVAAVNYRCDCSVGGGCTYRRHFVIAGVMGCDSSKWRLLSLGGDDGCGEDCSNC